jgi:hypothetical protein
MPLLAIFDAFTLIHWVIFSVALLFVVFTVATFEDSRGWSAVWILATLMLAVIFGLKLGLGLFQGFELTLGTVGMYVLYWFALGLGTAFVYWISNVRRYKERFVANMEYNVAKGCGSSIANESLRTAYLRALSINNGRIFSRYIDKSVEGMPYTSGQLSNCVDVEVVQDCTSKLNAYVNEYLPPKFTHFKADLLWAMTVWPMTLVWLVFHRAFKQLATWLLGICKEVFNWVSVVVFGKF